MPDDTGLLSLAESQLLLGRVGELLASRKEVRIAADDQDLSPLAKPLAELEQEAARLESLFVWRDQAAAYLGDLTAGRYTATASTPRLIAAALDPQADTAVRELIGSMSKNALTISRLEAGRGRWHVAVKAAQEAIALRGETAATYIGQPLPPLPGAHLALAYSRYMLAGNSPQLRAELAAALEAQPAAEGIAYWLARYEIMAGRCQQAYAAIAPFKDRPRFKADLLPLLVPSARAPWQSFPSNFYLYRHRLVSDDQLHTLIGDLETILNTSTDERKRKGAGLGIQAARCRQLWNRAGTEMDHGLYASAARYYYDCRREILAYFRSRYGGYAVPNTDEGVYAELVKLARERIRYGYRTIWTHFRTRYQIMDLEELYVHDWKRPQVAPEAYLVWRDAQAVVNALEALPTKLEEKVDAPLLAMAMIFVPLGLAESNRMRRNFDPALSECRQILRRHKEFKLLSQVIEVPFVKILIGQILLEKAETEFMSRTVAAQPEKKPDGSLRYQGLAAAETYKGVLTHFQDEGEYVRRVNAGVTGFFAAADSLLSQSFHPLSQAEPTVGARPPAELTPAQRRTLKTLGKAVPIETIRSEHGLTAGANRRTGPHESLVRFVPPQGGHVLKETNPVIYALIIQAAARLVQLESGLNYLGYRDDYVPPWRFHYLLERARYFAEHAKASQARYLEFLTNAEREEYQEMSVAQNVTMERANIALETARVEHSQAEVEAAKQGAELADLVARNADTRVRNYASFMDRSDELANEIMFWGWTSFGGAALSGMGAVITTVAGGVLGAVGGGAAGTAAEPGGGTAVGGVGGAALGALAGLGVGSMFLGGGQVISAFAQQMILMAQLEQAAEQRDLEYRSLKLNAQEAHKSAEIAGAQLEVARAGLVVSGLQRTAALLRHEFAVESLTYMRNRTMNAELWFRLSHLIRGVSDTYMRYAVELAFLAEQAYEYEADKSMNVIRFDYGASEYGSMLAADFLLADLDTLEQDMIVTQRLRQQHVRYVMSLAREYPSALQQLRENGTTVLTLNLEQLERRFPGLLNLRIGSVDVSLVALMDPTRFSLGLTSTGSSQVRLKGDGSGSGSTTPSWLPAADDDWPVRVQTSPPQTAIFSGLSRSDRDAAFSFVATNQRGAFENLGAGTSWWIDMSMQENRVDPSSLADVLINLTLSGYHDPVLAAVVQRAPARSQVLNQWLSARARFPDANYEFHRSGRMTWQITPQMLSLRGAATRLRNLGVILLPSFSAAQFNRLSATYAVQFTVTAAGALQVQSEVPQFAFDIRRLQVTANATVTAGASVRWRFGDGTDWQAGAQAQHLYNRPGRYLVQVHVHKGVRLYEYTAELYVSRTRDLTPPLAAYPALVAAAGAPAGLVRVEARTQAPAGVNVASAWRFAAKQQVSSGQAVTLDLAPGEYTLQFVAVRELNARVYSSQWYVPNAILPVAGLRLASNRSFDEGGTEVNQAGRNALANHLFGGLPLSPADGWTLEINSSDNPSLVSVTASDTPALDLGLDDAILVLEYEMQGP